MDDIDNLVISVKDLRTGNARDISLAELSSLLNREEKQTPRSGLQVLPIITSRQITLSFRPTSPDSISMEIDTGGDPVYVEISAVGLNVYINSSFQEYKDSISYKSPSSEVMVPLSDKGSKSAVLRAEYDGRNLRIAVLFF